MIIGVKAELDKILLTPDVKHYSFTIDIYGALMLLKMPTESDSSLDI